MYLFTNKEVNEGLIQRHTQCLQKRLYAGNVAIAGLGGLGSNIAIWLARIGVGTIHLIDYDRVELTNLNRQHYFMEHVGMYKTDALLQQIYKINPYLNVVTDCLKVNEENMFALFDKNDIICEAFDQPKEKAMLVNGIVELFPQKCVVAASGMAGFESSNKIVTRCLGEKVFLCGDSMSSFEDPTCLMAPRVALCAAHQANMITRLIVGQTTE
ncbi:MAG: sulfur carrier protein ThiS adenylyltransferase ThiF [Lachnospiraceae bacterium]